MPACRIVVDGHTLQLGNDTYSEGVDLTRAFTSFSVNRQYRRNRNCTRRPFHSKNEKFESPELEEKICHGNVRGLTAFSKVNPFTQPHLVMAVGDCIVAGRLFADQICWRKLYDGINPKLNHAWFQQAYDHLIFQDGENVPLVWDGNSVTEMEEAPSIPVGSVMGFSEGRLLVEDGFGVIRVSDHLYARGPTSTKGILDFNEDSYPNGGGGFVVPGGLGENRAIVNLPAFGTPNGERGTGILTSGGMWVIDLSGPRLQWQDGVIATGVTGISGPYSAVTTRRNIWYRSSSQEVTNYLSQASDNSDSQRSLSREVSRYLSYDLDESSAYSYSMYVDNMLMNSFAIRTEASENSDWGAHRFGHGIVVLDFEGGSISNENPRFGWHGVYTGVRPTGMVNIDVAGENRGYITSYDKDGKNRVYELMQFNGNDRVGNTEIPIKSFYTVEGLFSRVFEGRDDKDFTPRAITLRVSDMRHAANLWAYTRPTGSQCWDEVLTKSTAGCLGCLTKIEDCIPRFSKPLSAVVSSGQSNDARSGFAVDMLVATEGFVTIDKATVFADVESGRDIFLPEKGGTYDPEWDCDECGEYCWNEEDLLFGYCIVREGYFMGDDGYMYAPKEQVEEENEQQHFCFPSEGC